MHFYVIHSVKLEYIQKPTEFPKIILKLKKFSNKVLQLLHIQAHAMESDTFRISLIHTFRIFLFKSACEAIRLLDIMCIGFLEDHRLCKDYNTQ